MSAFGIFVLILTTAYIIYFSVVIVRDTMSSRKSGNDNPDTETFDTSFMDAQSVEVRETDGGFAVGEEEIFASPVITVSDDDKVTATKEAEKSAEDAKAKLENEMTDDVEAVHETVYDTVTYFNVMQGQMSAPDAARVMVKRHPKDPTESTTGDEEMCDHY